MTPLVDDMTSALIAILFTGIAVIHFGHSTEQDKPSLIITGLAAALVAATYATPLVSSVQVVDIRGLLRFSLVIYSLNFIISYHTGLLNIARAFARRVRQWRLHRR